ncbi:MAG: acetyl-CoA synthase subunit delta [Candidatus Bathyarchaeia archaeon]
MEDLFKLLKPVFEVPEPSFPGRIVEVTLGSTIEEGGSSLHSLKLGGCRALPFYSSETKKPILASIVYDSPEHLPPIIRGELGSLAGEPVEWAKACRGLGAEAIALKLQGVQGREADPRRKVEDLIHRLLEEVQLPLIVGLIEEPASAELLKVAAETAEGERCVLASATLGGDCEDLVEAAVRYGHSIVAETDCDPASQRSLNQKLLDMGLAEDKLLMDPTSAALGLGIEYSVSIIEQIRLDALKGDETLRFPIVILRASEYAWKAREAWDPGVSHNPALMGPLWEAHTALTLYLAGADLLAILHPRTLKILKGFLSEFSLEGEPGGGST